ncbi:MAG: flagellar assembly protein FliW [candidate division Zixibacteria bacterium]|nr:flagellar assembly protein FliW [candidate division Zixibacteria bacterium]
MKVNTTRFGELDVPDTLIIRMTKPVLGFEQLKRFVIVETADFEPFKWFQAVDDPQVAFVIVNPLLFFPEYGVEVNPREIDELRVSDVRDVDTYAIVTIPQDFTRMTANLQGPILVNTRSNLAKQLVLVNSTYRIRHLMLPGGRPEPVHAEAEVKEPVGV